MVPSGEAVMMYKLCCVGFFAEYRQPVRMDLEIEEVWDTVLELVNGEFQVLVVAVEFSEDPIYVFWLH